MLQPNCSPFGCTRNRKVRNRAVLMLIVDAETRDCSLDSIDAQFPKSWLTAARRYNPIAAGTASRVRGRDSRRAHGRRAATIEARHREKDLSLTLPIEVRFVQHDDTLLGPREWKRCVLHRCCYATPRE